MDRLAGQSAKYLVSFRSAPAAQRAGVIYRVMLMKMDPLGSLGHAPHHRITRGHRNIVMHGHLTLRCAALRSS